MCGIIGYKVKGDNSKIRLRGQDLTNEIKVEGFTFIHNLLAVTGEYTPQPFVEDGIVCLYNGEIYNHKFKKSDGEVLIPLYKEYGVEFAKHLDGEFAIVLFDFNKKIAVYATDPFKTKPLFINGLDFASYSSGVGGEKANPNEIIVKNFDGEIIHKSSIFDFDFKHQHKDTYDDWITAFEKSIKKRAKDNCFLGLSSGYDSGAIACEMLNQGVDFKAYIYNGLEDMDVLRRRKAGVDYEDFVPDKSLVFFLRRNLDDEEYTIKYKSGMKLSLFEDGGYLGVATIADMASREGRKVCMSGQGADEILSDYALYKDQSELEGVFANDLNMWYNFNRGCQESYLIKEEYAGGAFNIETRYPFLDKDLVQEFLWITAQKKNAYYKAPLREYLIRNNYPFSEGKKIGFSIVL